MEKKISISLTRKQKEVMNHLSHGESIEEIAETLGVSTSAIHLRIQTVRKKLRAKNTTHAMAIALKDGLLD